LDGTGSAFASVVPTMVRWLVQAKARLQGVTLLVGGGPLDPELRDAAAGLGARVVETYGLTEACGGVTYDREPLRGTEIRIAEPEGEIQLRGPTMMEGYRSDPDQTAKAFTLDGWLRTADLGELDAKGHLIVHGRSDDVIRTGGEKVWPQEVERVLVRHEKVGGVAVAGRPDAEWGEHVAAWVVPAITTDPPTLDELRELCREHLARFKAPRELFVVHELPTTISGKVRRTALES
jgi:O-succinylbenzoic acid--CoA ligase